MSSKAIIRCDYFTGSGVGHLKRSAVLATALQRRGVEVTLVVDSRPLNFNWVLNLNIEVVSSMVFLEDEDAERIIEYSKANEVGIVVVDSYRITNNWVHKVKSAGLRVVAIDDLSRVEGADLRVNYAPLSMPLQNCSQELLGPSYFITDTKRSTRGNLLKPQSIIFHAGGNGDFSSNELTIQCLSREARRCNLRVTWLIANQVSKSWLQEKNLIDASDTLREWEVNASMHWGAYDIVVGPASTSLYEAIMQGSLPISYTISPTQKDERSCWLSLGHALHITNKESEDASCIKNTLRNAVEHYVALREYLFFHSKELDGLGVHRIIDHLLQEAGLSARAPSPKTMSQANEVRPCEFVDAAEFLNARNAEPVRSLSTNDREITWPEHLNWWLTNNAEKFVVLNDGETKAFFWHRSRVLDGNKFLIGGWFPANSQAIFDTAVRFLDWQLKQCAMDYDGHLWVATINPANRAVIALNKKFGFQEASPNTRKYLEDLFPGTPNNFVALERPARP